MADELEAPESPSELFLATGEEVSEARPLLTGDVLQEVEIPGLEGSGDALILAHPCSMRQGAELRPRILMARVSQAQEISFAQWKTGYYRIMPLPELYGPGTHAKANFDELGLVQAEDVRASPRLACLSRKGINLLQQRFIFHLTRLAVPTYKLDQVAAGVFEEVDLAEEWIVEKMKAGQSRDEAFGDFHNWITDADDTGQSRQQQLLDPQRLPSIRRQLREAIQDS